MRYFYILFFGLLAFSSFSQEQDAYLKELGVYDQTRRTLKDTTLVNTLNKACVDSMYTSPEKSELYAKSAIKISGDIENYKGQIEGYLNLGKTKIFLNEFDSTVVFADVALGLSKKYHFDLLVVKSIDLKGTAYSYKGEYDKASKLYFNALGKAEKIHERHTVKGYSNMGHVYLRLNNNKKCRKYSETGYALAKKYEDTAAMITTLNLIALIDKRQKKPDDALERFEEGLELARLTNSIERQSQILYNMSNIYFNKKEYDTGFKLFHESLDISKRNGTYLSIAIGFHSLAMNYVEVGRLQEGNTAADSALAYAHLSKNAEMIMEAYAVKAEALKTMKRHKESLYYLEFAYIYKDSLNIATLNEATNDNENSYNKGKKHMADSLLQIQNETKAAHDKAITDQQVKLRDTLLWISGLVLVLVIIGLYYLKKSNSRVKDQNLLVKQKNEEIQLQHKEITDSILYAERIQDAIISKEGQWQKISDENFILFKPKDVVSGDFYWAYNNEEKNLSIWAVSDCTGHGVPGAFMSMLGAGFLNEIVIENNTIDPGTILDLLRSRIVTALTQKGEAKTKDGMDISICVWDKSRKKLTYAGANNPLWIVRHKDSNRPDNVRKVTETEGSGLCLLEIAPDKMPVGYQFATPPPFTTRKVDVLAGDMFVLISDGFADQFGGEKGKKFKSLPLKQLILEIQNKPMKEQRSALDETFVNWKGDEEQVDDVCIVGVKVSSLT